MLNKSLYTAIALTLMFAPIGTVSAKALGEEVQSQSYTQKQKVQSYLEVKEDGDALCIFIPGLGDLCFD